MAKTIDDVIAESEIRDVHLRYCRANDRRDDALLRSCFHSDAVIELHKEVGVEEFIAFGDQVLSHYLWTWHNTGNQLVEVDGDVAWAEHYTVSSHRMAADEDGPERDWVSHGRYVDRMEKRDGTWRIARRRMLVDFGRMDLVVPGVPSGAVGGATRDRNDPSYAMRLQR